MQSSNLPAENPLLASQPPVVVETYPLSGAKEVPTGETEIRVRFSKPMADGSWSWSTAWDNSMPNSIGAPRYLADHRTCVLKVRLEPGKTYGWWLNSEKFKGFKDQSGQPAVPYLLMFQTAPAPGSKSDLEDGHSQGPKVVSVWPTNGATDANVNQELRIQFDQPINPEKYRLEWRSGSFFSNAWPRYDPARNELIVSVHLAPGETNELAVQARSPDTGDLRGANFTRAEDYHWHFTTASLAAKPGNSAHW